MSGKLKEVRERISSVNGTKQITSAMKMVSAAKLRRAQGAIIEMRPYSDKLDSILRNILENLEGDPVTSLSNEREINSALIIVVTSNRGLAGAFNSNIIKAVVEKIHKDYSEVRKNGRLTLLCIGKKGHDYFRKRYTDFEIIKDYVLLFNELTFDNTAVISQLAIDEFSGGTYDAVDVAYGQFKNAGIQYPQMVRYLPVVIDKDKRDKKGARKKRADYIFEPDKHQLLANLIPTILQTSFHKFILETHASEHGARMTAMDKATENANEMLKDLRIRYNKARQEAITKELSEIVGGAAALES